MNKLMAYHGDINIKNNILSQLQLHYDADEFIKGKYWENGKGCAVGCTIHDSDHKKYETRFGTPIILAILEDRIFENLPNRLSKEWPINFMSSISVGADLSKVWNKFAIWLLTDNKYGAIRYSPNTGSILSIQKVSDLYIKSLTEDVNILEWIDARDAAAASAAASAAYASDADNADISKENHYIAQSEKLLELLREAR